MMLVIIQLMGFEPPKVAISRAFFPFLNTVFYHQRFGDL